MKQIKQCFVELKESLLRRIIKLAKLSSRSGEQTPIRNKTNRRFNLKPEPNTAAAGLPDETGSQAGAETQDKSPPDKPLKNDPLLQKYLGRRKENFNDESL
jgi:hypothetical protein